MALTAFGADNKDVVIKEGVFAGQLDLSGMTETEAEEALNSYVETLENANLELRCVSGNSVNISAKELDSSGVNP